MHSRRRTVSFWGLLLLGSSALPADDLTGRVELSWRDYERDSLATDGLYQFYEVSWDRQLTEAFRVRLGLRAIDDASGSTLTGERRSRDYREVEPRLRLSYRRPTLDFESWWSGQETRSVQQIDRGEEVERRQSFDRLRASLVYRPAELPIFGVDGYRREATRSESGERILESGGQARIDYSWQGLHLLAAAGDTRVEDSAAGFERTSDDLMGQVDFTRSLWSGRMVVGATVNRFQSDIRRRALDAGGAEVPDPVPVLAVFQTYDQTPGDHFDQPLIPNQRLRDGDLEQPAGLPLGPSNLPDLNLALDFGRSAEVDEVRIVARDPLGNPLTTGGPVVWDVWVSDDGIRWLPALEGATTAFDTARSHWSVRFPLRVARWIQVVSFFVNSVPTELTEVQAYASDAIPGGAPRSEDYLLESGRGNLTVRATDRVTVSWQGLWTRSRSARELRDETEISNSDQLLLLDWSLPADLSLELRGEFRDQERTEGIDRSSRGYQGLTGLLRWQPDPDLDTVLEVTRGRDEIDGVGLDLDRAFLRALLRPWRGLEISLDAGRQVQDFAGGLATIETPSASGYVKAWLAPSLIVTLQASTSRAKVDGELPPELLIDVQTDRWYADVQWVPSGRLNLGARFGRAEGGGTSTPIQAYRLIWSPFAGGAVALVARYDENVDPVRDRRSRRLIVTPTWTINRHLRLSLDFQQSQTSVAGEVDDIRSFSASLGTDF